MANSPQAKKRARQSAKRRLLNMSQRSALRTSIKSLIKVIEANDAEKAKLAFREASSLIDKAASKGLHQKNRAARLKSRLNARLRTITA